MKALHVDQHDYITVSAILGTCRLNITTSYSGGKVTVSSKASDPGQPAFSAAYKANIPILRKLMKVGFGELAPAGQAKNNGNGAKVLKSMIENSKDHAEFFSKLSAALVV